MESGTEPGEESWLQLSIMFLDCLFTIKDLLTFTHCSTPCFNFSFKIFYDAVDACICRQNLKFQIVLRFVFLTQQRGVFIKDTTSEKTIMMAMKTVVFHTDLFHLGHLMRAQ